MVHNMASISGRETIEKWPTTRTFPLDIKSIISMKGDHNGTQMASIGGRRTIEKWHTSKP